jgi:hypothetical protein
VEIKVVYKDRFLSRRVTLNLSGRVTDFFLVSGSIAENIVTHTDGTTSIGARFEQAPDLHTSSLTSQGDSYSSKLEV